MSLFDRPQNCPKCDHKIPMSWTKVQISISADTPESSLSDEVSKHHQLSIMAKWYTERCNPCMLILPALFSFLCLLDSPGVLQASPTSWPVI